MITHVAEAGENKGRVVVVSARGHPRTGALDAAVMIARAFGAAIEALIVENGEVRDLAHYPFARAVSIATGVVTVLAPAVSAADQSMLALAARRAIERHVVAAGIGIVSNIVNTESIAALVQTCRRCGPWNVIVLADPAAQLQLELLDAARSRELPATALVLAPPTAPRPEGAVVVVVEDAEQAPQMLRTAERLAAVDGRGVELFLLAPDLDRLNLLDAQLRLMIGAGPMPAIHAAQPSRGVRAAAIEALRRRAPRLVVMTDTSLLAEDPASLAELPAVLACPLLVTR